MSRDTLRAVQGDLTKLSTDREFGQLELEQTYKQTLATVFWANDSTLSKETVNSILDQSANENNRAMLVAMWEHEWMTASSQGLDDRVIMTKTDALTTTCEEEGSCAMSVV